ncbi:MAG: indolepyruvate oxidoreductase subunit beta [Candidatus Lokiarchaeota archaeon]|nr:indolepyruvate oxidoreductase subunit beta [Candidatus Lokiarchaeota archaeon]
MDLKSFNILMVGIGGQGVIRAIQILTWAALLDDYKVRTAETHGMAQRGGSVSSFLRFGYEVEGPLIPSGNSQIIIALEASEAARYFRYANSDTIFLINDKIIVPPTVQLLNMEYPDLNSIGSFLKQISTNVFFIKGHEEALKAGDLRSLNVYMIGVLVGSNQLPIKQKTLENSIRRFIPRKAQEINKIAFNIGIEKGKLIKGDIK